MPQATATVKGGLFETQGLATLTGIDVYPGFARRRIAMLLGRRQNMSLREIMETLNGAAAGSTAAKTLSRVEANSELGGARTVETETLVNRATVAGDVTEINASLLAYATKTTFGSSPPPNLDGNPLGTR